MGVGRYGRRTVEIVGLRKLQNGRWEGSYRDPRRRERTAVFDTRRDAERWVAANRADLVRGQWHDPRLSRMLLRDWTAEWWTTTTNLRLTTRVRDEGYLERYILPAFGDLPLDQVLQRDVQRWVVGLSDQGLAPATVEKAYQILSKVLRGAVDAGLLQTSPCRRVTLPRRTRTEMRFLCPEEIDRLADVIHPRYRALVYVAAYGGLRIGELAGLRRHRVAPRCDRIEVAEIAVEVRGMLTFGEPKTRAGRRFVTLPSTVAEDLSRHLETWAGADYVFAGPEGSAMRPPLFRQRFWTPAVRSAGLEPLRPHDLRHTAVALWIATGANPLEVSRRAGHSSSSFTLDQYGHLFPEADRNLADRLETLLRPERNLPSTRGPDLGMSL